MSLCRTVVAAVGPRFGKNAGLAGGEARPGATPEKEKGPGVTRALSTTASGLDYCRTVQLPVVRLSAPLLMPTCVPSALKQRTPLASPPNERTPD
jgi:hypothetical protein